jgi:glycosyltransferase involved in cell wall biosynthesis
MTGITAILHTLNDELRIARVIESIRSCDEVLVIDHGSSDETCATARRFGARVLDVQKRPAETHLYLDEAQNNWICCLRPTECLSESLEASLFAWKMQEHNEDSAYGVTQLEETPGGWTVGPAETRLVHRTWATWQGWKPLASEDPNLLEGPIVRLRLP